MAGRITYLRGEGGRVLEARDGEGVIPRDWISIATPDADVAAAGENVAPVPVPVPVLPAAHHQFDAEAVEIGDGTNITDFLRNLFANGPIVAVVVISAVGYVRRTTLAAAGQMGQDVNDDRVRRIAILSGALVRHFSPEGNRLLALLLNAVLVDSDRNVVSGRVSGPLVAEGDIRLSIYRAV